MARGATTARSAWGWRSPSDAGAGRRRGSLRGACLTLCLRLAASLVLAQGSPPAAAGAPQALWQQGDFVAAHEQAAGHDTAAMQTLAARAAVDQVAYVLAPAGAPLEEQLAWLRRGVSAAERAVALDPRSPAALVQLARAKGEVARRSGVLQNLNVATELKQLFDRALALEPENADALVGLAMWHLELVENGVGWLYGGRRDQVLPLLERGLAAAPTQVNLHVEHATALRALGQEERAREALRTALALPATSAVDRAEQRRAEGMLR